MDLLSSIPPYFRQPPVLIDELETSTSTLQAATVNECLPLLKAIEDPSRSPFDFNQFGVFSLQREDHVRFLHENLAQFPARFVGIDASRPWMVYWALAALHMLGEDVSSMRSRYYHLSCLTHNGPSHNSSILKTKSLLTTSSTESSRHSTLVRTKQVALEAAMANCLISQEYTPLFSVWPS